MGNISSRDAETYVDGYILRLARTIDSVLRTINRKLSTVSSLFFSRVFGYDVVVVDDACSASNGGLTRKDSLVCGPGNVCIVPASRLGQRQEEKRRKSERRRRAEAAALGEARLRRAGWGKVESVPSSPTEKGMVMASLGEVAKAPAARPIEERETVGERERGKLWVMGNVQPLSKAPVVEKVKWANETIPASPTSAIDHQVMQRMHAQRSNIRPDSTIIKRRIQPRQSSKSAKSLLASPIESPASHGGGSGPTVDAVPEKEEAPAQPGPTAAPQTHVLPPGALSLGPSPWEPCFSNPFTVEHEALPTLKGAALLPSKPKLSINTHLPPATLFVASPASMDDSEDPLTPAPRSRRPSASNVAPLRAGTRMSLDAGAAMARKSFDAASIRSIDSHHPAAIDVKTLATKAVNEQKGRKVWKDHVNKAAMQHCLSQQQDGRRFSTAGVPNAPLVRVKTNEGAFKRRRGSSPNLEATLGNARRESAADRGLIRVKLADGKGARRGSSPALHMSVGTGLKVHSPFHG